MKFRTVYTLFILMGMAVLFQSRSGGPGAVASLEVTGAPGSSGNLGTCGNAGCHTSGSFDPTVTLLLAEPNTTTPITEYVPGQTYWLDIITEATNGQHSATGFQAVVLDENDENAVTWSFVPVSAQITELSGRQYAEHMQAAPTSPFQLDWVAPPAGTGDITFYVSTLASNEDGTNGGDGVATTSVTLTEMVPSRVAQLEKLFTEMTVSPNPIADHALLKVNSKVSGDFQMNIIDTNGKQVYSDKINLQMGQNQEELHLSDLPSGMYFLQLAGEGKASSSRIIKL